MATNTLILSLLNPIKFVREGHSNAPTHNTKYFDEYRYQDTVRRWEEHRAWFQPWKADDTIKLQLLSNYAPFVLYLMDCDGNLIDSIGSMTYVASSVESTGLRVYEISIPLAGYDSGSYYIKMTAGSPVLETLISEVFEIGTHEDSVLLEYTHDHNDYNSVFENGLQFSYRVPGGLKDYQPGSDSTVFIDQPQNIVQLSARTFATERLIIGTAEGVPNWVAERVNEILRCSTVIIDGKQYVRNEGAAMEASREEDYPLVGWSVELRRSDAVGARVIDTDGNGNTASSVVYNIDTRGFGGITTPTGTNITQILAL